MAIPLTCDKCGKRKKFKNFDQVERQGWIIVKNKYGYDTHRCPECKEV